MATGFWCPYMISASRVLQSGLLEHAKQLRGSALRCTVLEVEDYSK